MAKLTQYTSQATPNVQQAVYASNAMADYSMAPAQGLARVGQSIDAMGQIAESYQRSMDNIRSVEANNLLETTSLEIDKIKEDNPNNPDIWEEQVARKLSDFDRKLESITKDVSSQRRGLLESEAGAFRKNSMVKTQIDKAKTAAKIELGKMSAGYLNAVSSGNDNLASNYKAEMDARWNTHFGSVEEYKAYFDSLEQQGKAEYDRKVMGQHKDFIAGTIEGGAGSEESLDTVQKYIDSIKDPSDRQSLMEYAEYVNNRYKVDSTAKRDEVLGSVSTEWRKLFLEGKLTEEDIQSQAINVPYQFTQDADEMRDEWVGRVRDKNKAKAGGVEADNLDAVRTIVESETAVRNGDKTVKDHLKIIDENVGKLKNETAREFYKATDTLGEKDSEKYADALRIIETTRDAEMFLVSGKDTDKKKTQIAIKYAELKNRFLSEVKGKSPEESIAIAKQYFAEPMKKVTLSWFDRALSNETEERSLRALRGKAILEDNGIWGKVNDKTRESMLNMLKNGKQPDEIVSLVEKNMKDHKEAMSK